MAPRSRSSDFKVRFYACPAQAGDERAVVVACGLHPGPADLGPPLPACLLDRREQFLHARFGKGEHEGSHDDFPVVVGHERHSRPLAHVDGHHEAAGGVEALHAGHEPGLEGAADEAGHGSPPGPGRSGPSRPGRSSWRPPLPLQPSSSKPTW
jgi:hypothetical protein